MYGYGHVGLLFWIVVLIVIFFVIYSIKGKENNNKESPKDILDKRYANGEIDAKEYKKIIETLKG